MELLSITNFGIAVKPNVSHVKLNSTGGLCYPYLLTSKVLFFHLEYFVLAINSVFCHQ